MTFRGVGMDCFWSCTLETEIFSFSLANDMITGMTPFFGMKLTITKFVFVIQTMFSFQQPICLGWPVGTFMITGDV